MSSPLPVNAKQNWNKNNTNNTEGSDNNDNNNIEENNNNTSQYGGYITEDLASTSYGDNNRAISTARLGSSPVIHPTRYNDDFLNDDALSHRSYGSTTTDLEQVLTNHSGTLFRPLSTASYNYEDNTISADLPDEKIARVVKRHLAGASSSSPTNGSSSPGSAFNYNGSAGGGGLSRVTTNNSNHPSTSGGGAININSNSDIDQDWLSDINNNSQLSSSLVTNSHQLPGGAITHDIYKWAEDAELGKHKRQRSQSVYLPKRNNSLATAEPTLAHLRDPGGFRRHFVVHKANREGKKPPHWMTRTFVDFLALYGHFGGEDLSDDEDEEDEDIFIEEGGMSSESLRRRFNKGSQGGGNGQGGDDDEITPLIRKAQANAVQGTATPAKAVFLLLKSFVGTGKFVFSSFFF